jgi:flavodoxin
MAAALVVFESIYGNTRAVAEAIGDGLRDALDAEDL